MNQLINLKTKHRTEHGFTPFFFFKSQAQNTLLDIPQKRTLQTWKENPLIIEFLL